MRTKPKYKQATQGLVEYCYRGMILYKANGSNFTNIGYHSLYKKSPQK
jgi:hypothetical protein